MDGSKAAEMVQTGAKIVELGGKLDELKKKRNVLNTDIAALEAELKPLLVTHSTLMVELSGVSLAPPEPSPAPRNRREEVDGGGRPTTKSRGEIARKIKVAIERNDNEENAPTASFIASVIDEDPVVVREMMMEMMKNAPPAPIEFDPEPEGEANA